MPDHLDRVHPFLRASLLCVSSDYDTEFFQNLLGSGEEDERGDVAVGDGSDGDAYIHNPL